MLNRLKTWCVVAGAVFLGISATACAQLSPASIVPRLGGNETDPAADPSLTAPQPTVSVRVSTDTSSGASSALGPQNVAVHRGSIDQTMVLTGRIAGAEEAEVNYPGAGKVDVIGVRPGDKVEQGQLLLQTDATDIQKDLAGAQARLETAALRLEQAVTAGQAQARAQQRDASKRAADDAARRQQAVQDAQVNLRKAQDDYQLVIAGPSATDKRIADATVAAAQAALTKVTADHDRLYRGPNPDDVHAAERALASAQTNLDTAQAEVDRLTRGPDQNAVRAAERDVERAQTALKVAQATKADGTSVTAAQRDAIIANSQLNLQDAQDRLTKIKQPTDPRDITIAQRNLQVAKTAADQAKERLDLVRNGADQATLDAADQAVDSAQTALDNATDKQTEVNSHPTPVELRQAKDRVDQAQAALTRAGQTSSSVDAPIDDGSAAFDMQILQKAVATEQANVDSAQKRLAETKLVAPFTGTVVSVGIRPGDTVDPAHPAFVISKPGAPVIRIDVTEQDAANLKTGQSTSVVLDGTTNTLSGTIASLTASQNGSGRMAQVKVDWGSGELPNVGRTAQVGVTLQHKDNVLLVPKKAVRIAGARQYVQYMNGSTRRVTNVEVGITTDQDSEILSGLSDGQIVVVGP
jgi:multidrug efflux pump subunit AcrA (membrane-fusion protein)